MHVLNSKRILFFFSTVFILILAQVGWWMVVFTHQADEIATLSAQSQMLEQPSTQSPIEVGQTAQNKAYHRKVMFVSESLFFIALVALGFILLLRSLQRESKSQQLQKRFIEIVSHESKTPLTSLKLQISALKSKLLNDPLTQEKLSACAEDVERLSWMLDKTFQLYRVDRNDLEWEDCHLAEIVEQIYHRMKNQVKNRNATLSVHIDEDLVVKGDRYCLEILFQTLLENAMVHNPEPQKIITIHAKASGKNLEITIEDNGPGVAQEERTLIFEKFYRGQSSKKVSGTGLGLYIASHIVKAHLGKIEWKEPSIFQITLPRRAQ